MDIPAYETAEEHEDKPRRVEGNMDTAKAWVPPRLEEAAQDDPAAREQAPISVPVLRQADIPATDVAEDVQDTAGNPDTAGNRGMAMDRGNHTADPAEDGSTPAGD